jgi:hypothetical protein
MHTTEPLSSELENAIEQVLRRSAIDQDFRDLAITSASTAISRFDRKFSQVTPIRFVENYSFIGADDPETHTIVLPKPAWSNFELSDAELGQFAGAQGNGCPVLLDPCCYCTACCCTACCITTC